MPDTQTSDSSSQLADALTGGNTAAPILLPSPTGALETPEQAKARLDASPMGQSGPPQEIPPTLAPSATSAPAAAPPTPAGQPSVWKDLAMGALWGLAGSAGAKSFGAGLAGGAKGVLVDKPEFEMQQKQQAADIRFKSAQAADLQINYAYKEKQLNNLSQEQQDAHARASLDQLETLKSMGLTPVAVTGDNPGDAQATGRNLMQSHGGVPPLYTVDIGNQHVSFDLSQVAGTAQGLALLNRQRADMGQSALTPQEFSALYPNPTAQIAIMHSAMDYAHPVVVDQKSLDDARARLNTIQGQRNLTPEMQQDANSLKAAIAIGEKSVKEQNDAANRNAAAKAQAEQLAKESTPGGQAEIAKNQAQAAKTQFELGQARQGAFDLQKPDVTGFKSNLPVNEYNKRFDAFTKSKQYTTLQTLQGSYQQFQNTVQRIAQTGEMNGAESVVGLFNAIGISATPLAGKGFRINQNTVEEHENARGIGQSAYQRLLKLKAGDVITPKQLVDYANIAGSVYRDSFVSAADEAHRQGLPVDFLPRGGGNAPDAATKQIYYDVIAHQNPASSKQQINQAARQAAAANGWQVQ